MAYITYRQSDKSQTEAQTSKKDVVKGAPLTMYEVDANFKSVNDHLNGLKDAYGVGATLEEGSSIAEVYGENNANKVSRTGFYSTVADTSNMPSTTSGDGSALLHMESVKQTAVNKLSAFEITSDTNNLWHRIRRGKTSWDSWKKVLCEDDITQYQTNINNSVKNMVLKTGDTMTGDLAVTNNANINIVNIDAIKNYGVHSTKNTVGVSFCDRYGTDQNSSYTSNRLGSISSTYYTDNNTSYNETFMMANNHSVLEDEMSAYLAVGWTRASINNATSFIAYSKAPQPQLDITSNPDQIATVKWTADYTDKLIKAKFNPDDFVSVDGGTVRGLLRVENDIDVTNNIDCDGDVSCDSFGANVAMISGPIFSVQESAKDYSSNPTTALISGVSFTTTGAVTSFENQNIDPAFTDSYQHGGVINSVNTSGLNDTYLMVKQWNKCNGNNIQQHTIGISVNNSGVVKTHAPTPAADSVGSEIITAEWIKLNMAIVDFGEM